VFSDFPLDERLLKALDTLSFTQPTEVQEKTLPLALEGKDLLVTAETGSGKTLAFSLPLLQKLKAQEKPNAQARALILAPTRELALQIQKELVKFSQFTFITSDTVCGGEPFKPQAARLRKNPEILIATPGRLVEHLDKSSISLADVEVLVLDEADRMLEMGFQEDMERILGELPAGRQSLLFSATLGHKGMSSVIASSLQEPVTLTLSSRRSSHANITQQVIPSADNDLKDKQALWLLNNETFDKAIVFVNTKVQAARLNGYLRYHKIRAGVIQGDLTQEQRKHVIGLLKQGKINVLVATEVAARGLDVEGIDLVINYEMARKGDEHTHRVGRTGRAGNQGLAISLVAPSEWNLMVGIERYLKAAFERRTIKGLEGSFTGPKKTKASGKAVGNKKKKATTGKNAAKSNKPKAKHKARAGKPSRPAAEKVVDHGFAPFKKKTSE
jgi:superfamily II DNA/RNA helicase